MVADDERIGCHSSRGSAQDFNDFIQGAGLMDIGFNGNTYAWSMREHGLNTKWDRLDNFLINYVYGQANPNWRVEHLSRSDSDHTSI